MQPGQFCGRNTWHQLRITVRGSRLSNSTQMLRSSWPAQDSPSLQMIQLCYSSLMSPQATLTRPSRCGSRIVSSERTLSNLRLPQPSCVLSIGKAAWTFTNSQSQVRPLLAPRWLRSSISSRSPPPTMPCWGSRGTTILLEECGLMFLELLSTELLSGSSNFLAPLNGGSTLD